MFLWIKDYRNIVNQGFNFSSKYSFKHEIDEPQRLFTLTVRRNDLDIPEFFGKNILNVTAIVGSNGTGKSNLVDYLIAFLGNNTYFNEEWLAVFFNNEVNEVYVYHSLFKASVKKFKAVKTGQWKVVVKKENVIEKINLLHADIDDFNMWNQAHLFGVKFLETSRVIFYSPFLDFRKQDLRSVDNDEKVKDISQNALISNDIQEALQVEENPLERHKRANVERQFLFIQRYSQFPHELNLPNEITLKFYKSLRIDTSDLGFIANDFLKDFSKFSSESFYGSSGANQIIQKGKENRDTSKYLQGRKEKAKLWFIKDLINNFFYNLDEYKDLNDSLLPKSVKQIKIKNRPPLDVAFEFFRLQKVIPKSVFDIEYFINEVLKTIDQRKQEDFDYFEENECVFSLPSNEAMEIIKLHTEYVKSFDAHHHIEGFLGIDWRNISSGEKAFLDLFSRIELGFKKIEDQEIKIKSDRVIYLLLDEGDIAFHPRWQKSYLTRLLEYLKTKTYRIQLFITTHSPYIVSDLPHSNIVLLSKVDEKCIVVPSLDKSTKTFGANIHELLADSFFMDKTLFGDFAHKKIEEIFKWTKNEIRLSPDYVKKVIDLIDEPIIAFKLTELYAEKMGLNIERERLVKQLELLSDRLKSINDNDTN